MVPSPGFPRLYRFLTTSPVAVRLTRDPRLKMAALRAATLRARLESALRSALGGPR